MAYVPRWPNSITDIFLGHCYLISILMFVSQILRLRILKYNQLDMYDTSIFRNEIGILNIHKRKANNILINTRIVSNCKGSLFAGKSRFENL